MTAKLYLLDTISESSYKEHQYRWWFYALARVYEPQVCIELGVLQGYSLLATAIGLQMNGKGIIHGYDLWEKYPHRSVSQEVAQRNVDRLGLTDYVQLHTASAYLVPERWDNGSVDWVHVDLSNDGEIVDWALSIWRRPLRDGGLLLLEGGAEERDQVEWMVKYEKVPIMPVLRKWDDVYEIFTFEPMPSLTVCKKRGGA